MHAIKLEEQRPRSGDPQLTPLVRSDGTSVQALTGCAESPCYTCALRASDRLCGILFDNDGARATPLVARSHQVAARRRIIYRNNEPCSSVGIICGGWACAYMSLASGKRQILSFLLPGDITSASAVFQEQSAVSIEAVTDIRYCMIDKAELKSAILDNREIAEMFSRLWAEHENTVAQLATDLGHKTAEQRIAGLVLGLMKRHQERDLVRDGRFDFPLRQQHMADATGLTVVHVNRVIGNLRRLGIIEIKGRTLTVLNRIELQRLAQ